MLDPIVQYAGDPNLPTGCLKLIAFIKAHGYEYAKHWALAHGYSLETINSVITACKLR